MSPVIVGDPELALSQPTVVEMLVDRLSAVSYADAPLEVRQKVEDCILHALVVAAGAGETDFPSIVQCVISESLAVMGEGGSTVLLGSGRAPAATASWANAVLLHARVQEDTHDTVHPGVVVIPAALALAEREGASGLELLDAVLRGYEAATALSAVLNSRVTPPLRATGAFGPIAAAVAGASILRLDPGGLARAVALAASMAGGTTESFAAGTQEWHFQAGQATQTGVVAADLARAGVPASRMAFEGNGGFLAAYAGGIREDDAETVSRRLSSGWGVLEVTFKPYPVCAFNQAPAAAALDVAAQLGSDEVETVEVRMSLNEATYPGVDNSGPILTPEQAIMSAQCAVAAALLDQNVTFRRLRDADSPAMWRLMERTKVLADETVPNKSAVVSAQLVSGRTVSSRSPDMDAALRWGHAEVLSNAERLLPETNLTAETLERLNAAVAGLSAAPDLRMLLTALP